jgi:NifU-like protein involved in Fe-S cluster formation
MVTQMIGVGEATGAMDSMLQKIADFYEDEVDSATKDMLALLGVPLTTMRVKCAMLALRALEKAIHRYEEQGTVSPQVT